MLDARLSGTVRSNKRRQKYILAEVIEKVISVCPTHDWTLVFALTRYAGLRCPSEVLALRWSDVDLPGDRMLITSRKTAHAGKPERMAPILPELRKYLEPAHNAAPEGAEYVIHTFRDTNPGTYARYLVQEAGVEVWPSLFVNLRRSWVNDIRCAYPGCRRPAVGRPLQGSERRILPACGGGGLRYGS